MSNKVGPGGPILFDKKSVHGPILSRTKFDGTEEPVVQRNTEQQPIEAPTQAEQPAAPAVATEKPPPLSLELPGFLVPKLH